MRILAINFPCAFLMTLLLFSCDSQPRVIESESTSTSGTSTNEVDDILSFDDVPSNEHKVVVEDALHTPKYSYLEVSEDDEKFWIAISKREVKIGDTYYYKGGLLKKNFYSQEFKRTFETVYLVSNIWQDQGTGSIPAAGKASSKEVSLEVGNIQAAEGAIKIADLLANKEKYNGKLVKITGKCVKVNPMIMNRNWLHIKDGSTEELDLTVTTSENIPLGAVLSLEGTIALDKDFGSGYRYDIIMEGAVMR